MSELALAARWPEVRRHVQIGHAGVVMSLIPSTIQPFCRVFPMLLNGRVKPLILSS